MFIYAAFRVFFLVYFLAKIELLIMYIVLCPQVLLARRKRASNLIIDGCEPPCGFWELNSEHLKEQSMLLT